MWSIWVCSYLGMNLCLEFFQSWIIFQCLLLNESFFYNMVWESKADQKYQLNIRKKHGGPFLSASAGLPVIINIFYVACYLNINMNQKRKHFIVQIQYLECLRCVPDLEPSFERYTGIMMSHRIFSFVQSCGLILGLNVPQ